MLSCDTVLSFSFEACPPLRRLSVLALVLVSLGFTACASAPAPDLISRIDDSIAAWPTRDGALGIQLGEDLSRAFVGAPDDFFFAMAAAPAVFDSWLAELPLHTLTVFDPSQATSARHLLDRMRSRAARYSTHSRYGNMASRISAALAAAQLTFVD